MEAKKMLIAWVLIDGNLNRPQKLFQPDVSSTYGTTCVFREALSNLQHNHTALDRASHITSTPRTLAP